MSTLKAVFPEWQEGDLFTLTEMADWHMLTPVKGDVAWISLPTTDMENAPNCCAAFLILDRSVTGDGGMTLTAKFIASEDQGAAKELSTWFNRRGGGLHLCSSSPCTHFDPALLHCTQVRFFTVENFAEDCYGPAQRRQVKKWLGAGEVTDVEGEPREIRVSAEEDGLSVAKKVGREKGKGGNTPSTPGQRPGVLRKRPAASVAAPGTKPGIDQANAKARSSPKRSAMEVLGEEPERELAEDLRIEEGEELSKAGTADLKKKLETLRLRLGGDPKPKRVQFDKKATDIEPEDAEQEASAGTDFALGPKGLNTGPNLRRVQQPSEATRGISSKSISSQLALQAQQMAEVSTEARKSSRTPASSKEGEEKEVLALLNRVLRRSSSAGRSEDGGDPPDRDEKRGRSGSRKKGKKKRERGRKKKRKLINGVLMSASSSEDSSEDLSSSGSKDFEAPLRKRAKASPGSVLRLLVKRAQTALDQSALVDMDPLNNSAITTGVKLVTYYQLHIRPHYAHARGQLRDMHLMAQTLDLLRAGLIAQACDHLAGHFIAIHQSLIDQGWGQARYLEVIEGEEMGATPASILLETRRHAKTSMRAENPEAWLPGRNRGWFGGDSKGKGWWPADRGKGKGKKGKWRDKDKNEKGKEGKGKNVWKESMDKGEQAAK